MENPFKWRHFQGEIILTCTRWYLRYALSYRDLEEMMTERGLSVDHTLNATRSTRAATRFLRKVPGISLLPNCLV